MNIKLKSTQSVKFIRGAGHGFDKAPHLIGVQLDSNPGAWQCVLSLDTKRIASFGGITSACTGWSMQFVNRQEHKPYPNLFRLMRDMIRSREAVQ